MSPPKNMLLQQIITMSGMLEMHSETYFKEISRIIRQPKARQTNEEGLSVSKTR